jgi:hypothetical protein
VVFGVAPKTPSRQLFPAKIPEIVCAKSSGATPELARGTRALPIPISEFGFKTTKNISAGLMPGANESKLNQRRF